MSLESLIHKVSYNGNGTTDAFSFPHRFLDDSDLKIIILDTETSEETIPLIDTDYSVTGAGGDSGGTVTFNTPPTSTEVVIIYRDPALTQEWDPEPTGPVPPDTIESALDKTAMIDQRTRHLLDRSLKLPDSYLGDLDPTLPNELPASELFGISADGETIETYSPEDIGSEIVVEGLSNVAIDGEQTGDVLRYNESSGDWENETPTWISNIESEAFGDLSDVIITEPANGHVPTYQDGTWVNQLPPSGVTELDNLTDVKITSPEAGHVLVYDSGDSEFQNIAPPWLEDITEEDLADLSDVTITTPEDGQVLVYDTGAWVNGPAPSTVEDIDDLGDVTITTPENGQVLTYADGTWVNEGFDLPSGTFDGLTDTDFEELAEGDIAIYDGESWVNQPLPEGGGAGGGGSLRWTEGAPAPMEEFSSNVPVRRFPDGEDLYMFAAIRVPTSYEAGDQITCKVPFLSSGTSGTALVKALTTLIRVGTDAISSTTNQHTSTNSAETLSAGTANEPINATLDLTDSSGEINSVAVSPGDILIVRLTRDVSTDTTTADVDVILDCAEVLFA